jgi:Transcription factor subunit Med10 of Mediator complex
VDKGKNPELFTKQSLDECVSQNKATKGRLDAMRVFRETLQSELGHAFPEDTKLFNELVASYEQGTSSAHPELSSTLDLMDASSTHS